MPHDFHRCYKISHYQQYRLAFPLRQWSFIAYKAPLLTILLLRQLAFVMTVMTVMKGCDRIYEIQKKHLLIAAPGQKFDCCQQFMSNVPSVTTVSRTV